MIFHCATGRLTPALRAVCMVMVTAIAVACFPANAFAQAFSWGLTGTGGPGTWDSGTTANWWNGSSNVVWPVTGTSARFGGTAGTVTISGSVTATDLTFLTTGYTLTGGTLGLTGASSVAVGTGTTATITSVIGGASGLSKTGGGLLILNGANAYSGATTIGSGTLRTGNALALGGTAQGTTVSAGATLDINAQNLGAEVITISGTGFSGAGAIVNNGASQTNALGRIVLAANASVGGTGRWDLRNSSPTLDMGGFTLTKVGANIVSLVGVTVSNPGNVVVNAGEFGVQTTTNLGGSAANSITVNNTGTISNFQTSATGGQAWTLNLNNGSTYAVQSSAASTHNTWSGPVNVSGTTTMLSALGVVQTISGSIAGSGAIVKSGFSLLTIANGSNTFSGSYLVNTGTLAVSGSGSLAAATVALNSSTSTLDISGATGSVTVATLTGSAGSTVTLGARTLVTGNATSGTFGGSIAGTGGLTKQGAGTLTLTALNTYTGTTTISSGTVQVSGVGTVGTGPIANAGTLTFSGSASQLLAGAVSGAGAINVSNGLVTITGSSNTYSGPLTVTGGTLAVIGTGALSASGTTQVSGGVVSLETPTSAGAFVLNGGTLRGGFTSNVGAGAGATTTVDTVGGLVTHVFTNTGTTSFVVPTSVTGASALVVGGGGGGGGGTNGAQWDAGGGGGRVLNQTGVTIASGTTGVNVGAGGLSYGANISGGDGGASSFGAVLAVGGTGAKTTSSGTGGTSGSGNAGGVPGGASFGAGGGGGDAAAGGSSVSLTIGGTGGGGTANTVITGFTGNAGGFFGGGGGGMGGGAGNVGNVGGQGGGGRGNVSSGTANTGGGGGARLSGGSGIVVVQYNYAATASTLALSGSIDLRSASTLDAWTTGGLVNVTGTIGTSTGTGGLTIASSLASGGIVQFSSPMTYLGNTTVASGAVLRTNATNALPSGSGRGNLLLSGTLDLNGVGTTTVNGLSGAGTVDNLLASATGSYTLVAGANDVTGTFAGTIRNTFGSVGLTKAGSGLLALTGSNTYTGATTISGGTLAVDGVLGNTAVSVAAATWLQGTGTIGGSVNVLGTLSPGNSPGVLTLGSVVLGGSSTTLIEIDGLVRGTDYDGVTITGTSTPLTYGGALSLTFGNLSAFANGTVFDVFNFTGGHSGTYSSVASTGFYSGTWSSLGSGTYQLVSGAQTLTFSPSTGDIIVVPEPAAIALVGVGLGLAGHWLRRRRAAA